MDGTRVLKKTGPSLLGYRPKDGTYELRAVKNGLEVWRRGTFNWTVELDFP